MMDEKPTGPWNPVLIKGANSKPQQTEDVSNHVSDFSCRSNAKPCFLNYGKYGP